MWRGSLLPLGRAAAPKTDSAQFQAGDIAPFGSAAQPSGSKLPRHKSGSPLLAMFCPIKFFL
ncbi:hypothetical protein DZG01_02725 [Pseudomonas fluorescens]|nr:hypothetical protein DZG01_02725 [Pseudomonas fluorescens]